LRCAVCYNLGMAPHFPRRRFQFRLRTLMIVVTLLAVVCGYVGRQAEIVRARQAWLKAHSELGSSMISHTYEVLIHGDKGKSPSLLRRCLGDHELRSWEVFRNASIDQLSEINALFPEATIYWDMFRQQPSVD
jgi:hypothetical protein